MILLDLNEVLDRGNPCSFIKLDEYTRLAVLIQYFNLYSGELFPELYPEELAFALDETAQ